MLSVKPISWPFVVFFYSAKQNIIIIVAYWMTIVFLAILGLVYVFSVFTARNGIPESFI